MGCMGGNVDEQLVSEQLPSDIIAVIGRRPIAVITLCASLWFDWTKTQLKIPQTQHTHKNNICVYACGYKYKHTTHNTKRVWVICWNIMVNTRRRRRRLIASCRFGSVYNLVNNRRTRSHFTSLLSVIEPTQPLPSSPLSPHWLFWLVVVAAAAAATAAAEALLMLWFLIFNS